MQRLTRGLLPGLVAVLLLLAAGCGADDPGTPGGSGGVVPSQGSPVAIKVAETAGTPAAFLAWGKEQGHFSRYGIDLQIDTSAGGATVIPGLLGGSYQVVGSNAASVLIAADGGLPVRIIGPGAHGNPTPPDNAGVMVPADSPIKEPADLAGKTVAVNTLKNLAEVTIRASLQAQGVDHSTVEWAEMPFPEMLAALSKGEVDAAFLIEPFVSAGTAAGNRVVLQPYQQPRPGLQLGTYVSSQQYIDANPRVIQAFRAGLTDTIADFNAQPDAFRTALTRFARMEPAVAEKVVLPAYKTELDVDSLGFMAGKLKEFGITNTVVDAAGIVAPATPA